MATLNKPTPRHAHFYSGSLTKSHRATRSSRISVSLCALHEGLSYFPSHLKLIMKGVTNSQTTEMMGSEQKQDVHYSLCVSPDVPAVEQWQSIQQSFCKENNNQSDNGGNGEEIYLTYSSTGCHKGKYSLF